MSGPSAELVLAPLRSIRRATIIWGVALAVLVAATVSVWPAFKSGSGVSKAIDQLPQGVVQAFGLEGVRHPGRIPAREPLRLLHARCFWSGWPSTS